MNIKYNDEQKFEKNKTPSTIPLKGLINLIRVNETSQGTVVKLNTNIDEKNSINYRESFDLEVARNMKKFKFDITKNLFADLSCIKSINSLGVLIIAQTHKLAILLGVNFVVLNASNEILDVLKLTGIQFNYSNKISL